MNFWWCTPFIEVIRGMSCILICGLPINQNNGTILKLKLGPKFLDTGPRIQ